MIATFTFVSLAWVLFRSQNIKDSIYIYSHVFVGLRAGTPKYIVEGIHDLGLSRGSILRLLVEMGVVLVLDFVNVKTNVVTAVKKLPVVLRWMLYYLIAMIIMAWGNFGSSSFIYFTF